jgi:hypothetical protein
MLRIVAIAVMVAALALAFAPVGVDAAPSSTPYGVNLLRNPAAEAATAAGGGIRGWEADGFEQVDYGTPGFPTVAEGVRIHGGHTFFAGGPKTTGCGHARQRVPIEGRASAIDQGHVEVDVSVRMATHGGDTDTAVLRLIAYNGHAGLGGNISVHATGTNGRFVQRAAQMVLPPQTRFLRVKLGTGDAEGTYCDAYFDNIRVKIKHI